MQCVRWARVLVICALFAGTREASGQVVVVVNRANPIQGISLQRLVDIYTGNKVTWSNNRKIYPVSLKSNMAITRSFFKTALGKSPREMKRVWIRLTLSGEAAPPKMVSTETETLAYVANNEGAIGFVGLKDVNENVRIIAVEGKLPSEKGYPLRFVQQP